MSFDHGGLMHDINDNLAVMRKSQPQVMASFGQLARAAMAEGALSAKHKELMALAIGVSQRCSGCVAFHVKALIKLPHRFQHCKSGLINYQFCVVYSCDE